MKTIDTVTMIKLIREVYNVNSIKVYPTISNQYSVVDKSMITVYLYKFYCVNTGNRENINNVIYELLKPYIQSEYGYINLSSLSKQEYNTISDFFSTFISQNIDKKNNKLGVFKIDKNILENIDENIINFFELLSEISMLLQVYFEGNCTVVDEITSRIEKIQGYKNIDDHIYNIVTSLEQINFNDNINFYELLHNKDNQFSVAYKMLQIPFKLNKLIRFNRFNNKIEESVLLHTYIMTLVNYFIGEYINENQLSIHEVINQSLFHDFTEYKGDDMPSPIKYGSKELEFINEKIENSNKDELKSFIGDKFFEYVESYKKGLEGFLTDGMDKTLARFKMYLEISNFHNYSYICDYMNLVPQISKIQKAMNDNRYKKLKGANTLNLLRIDSLLYCCDQIFNNYFENIYEYLAEEEIEEVKVYMSKLKELKNKQFNI